jgi:hypothetical protein
MPRRCAIDLSGCFARAFNFISRTTVAPIEGADALVVRTGRTGTPRVEAAG